MLLSALRRRVAFKVRVRWKKAIESVEVAAVDPDRWEHICTMIAILVQSLGCLSQ